MGDDVVVVVVANDVFDDFAEYPEVEEDDANADADAIEDINDADNDVTLNSSIFRNAKLLK